MLDADRILKKKKKKELKHQPFAGSCTVCRDVHCTASQTTIGITN